MHVGRTGGTCRAHGAARYTIWSATGVPLGRTEESVLSVNPHVVDDDQRMARAASMSEGTGLAPSGIPPGEPCDAGGLLGRKVAQPTGASRPPVGGVAAAGGEKSTVCGLRGSGFMLSGGDNRAAMVGRWRSAFGERRSTERSVNHLAGENARPLNTMLC